MGIYVSVRGWLECDAKQLAAIQAIIDAHDDGRYSHGWGTPRHQVGWACRVFFGVDMRESAVEWFLEQMREIAAVPADAEEDRVTGLFLASHEVTGMNEWQIRDGQLFIAPGDDRYHYLDA